MEGTRTEEKVIVASELRSKYPLKILFKVAHLSRSTYYYQLGKKDKDEKNKDCMQRIKDIYHEYNGRYGFRRITLELRRQDMCINKKKVRRLMGKLGLKGSQPKMKYRSYKGDMNDTTPNLMLVKHIDEENISPITKETSQPYFVMRNGQQTLVCSVLKQEHCTFLPLWICTVEKSLHTVSLNHRTMHKYRIC